MVEAEMGFVMLYDQQGRQLEMRAVTHDDLLQKVAYYETMTEVANDAIRRAQAAGDPDHGDTYYRHWLDALETLVISRGLADADRLHALEHAWEAAAERTSHGQPIELSNAEKALAD